jgi:hypothetical protein
MTRKVALIVAHTAMQAAEYAIARKLTDWRVVVHTNDLVGTGPVTHLLAFAGDWRKRSDIDAILSRARGRGFRVPP